MPIDPIFRPDNRLLALGTGDFSTFGAQPDPVVAFLRPAPSDMSAPSPQGPAGPPAGEERQPAGDSEGLAAVTQTEEGTLSPASPTSHADPAGIAPLQHDAEALDLPVAVQAGSTPPQVLTQSPTTGADGSAVGSSPTPVADMANHLSFALAPQIVDGAAILSPALSTLASVNDALDIATGRLDGLTTTLTQALEPSLATLGDGTDLADDVAGVATTGLLSAELPPAYDIDSLLFSGSDPDAGITTLVGLVQTSELFTIGQAETPSMPDASASMVDHLIDGGADVAPIADDAPVHDPLHDAIDHVDPGLGL